MTATKPMGQQAPLAVSIAVYVEPVTVQGQAQTDGKQNN